MDPKKCNKCSKQKQEADSPYDVLGSYTGTPVDSGEPVQDADDL